ncbi:hypothetical protein GO495_29995 [Chitinophaga oryziterrae]|uniref:RHS repeat-associated core domain-containing protein n=1 Tax=Chitinophaga oryziterrae TaxID=1031224 RepID=A0A6N8JL18_9BACT|nr:hypothetical protein [Chitinophaga oryziterrae]MVT44862.1 hypothetical protein [Chitinophaga oryziterrae]
MRIRLLAFIVFLLWVPLSLSGQVIEQSKLYYRSALHEMENMLSGKQPLSYERAIFLTENAWWNNQLSYVDFQGVISRDTAIIRTIIAQTRGQQEQIQPSNFLDALKEHSNKGKGYYEKALTNAAIFSYMTDTLYFVDTNKIFYHLPFSYATNDPLGSTDWTNTQATNLLDNGQGNCFAFVSLFKIFSERLNSDASVCTAPGHIYISHADDKGIPYNVEIANKAFPGTGTLSTLTHTTQDAIKNNISLRELDLKQTIALCLVYLAKGFEHKFNTVDDSFMMDCAELTLKYDSLSLNAMLCKSEILETRIINSGKSVEQLQSDQTFKVYQQLINRLYTLGYREMPLKMKNMLIKGWTIDTVAQPVANFNGEPTTRYASLSWGLFDEQIGTKPVERYGRGLFNTKQHKIIAFASGQTLDNNYNFDPVVFAWNIDPMAHKYPHASPYNFVENNPISRIDPDGADWILSTGNKVYWYGGKYGDKSNLLSVFKATSGMDKTQKITTMPNGTKIKETMSTQQAKYQKYPQVGPTPEGKYKINLKPDPDRIAEADLKTADLKRSPDGGIEKIPKYVPNPNKPGFGWEYSDWGENRARLEPVNVTGATPQDRDLNSFYFHDSQKGYSHGCTECETGLFDKLKEYRSEGNQVIEVKIQYPTPEHKTNGGTKKETTKTATNGN